MKFLKFFFVTHPLFSCWAFSATETIESAWIQAGKATADKLALSPQQIVDCDDWVLGCGGGQTGSAYNYG
jgi:cyclopropane fatty-acyl-phospholipid synthase-like methyltransferase